MDAAILIGIIAVSIALIVIAFIVGQKITQHQEKLNNDEVLRQRALIEKDIEGKRNLVAQAEQEYQSKQQLILDAQVTSQLAYDRKIEALDAEFQRRIQECQNLFKERYGSQEEAFLNYKQELEEEIHIYENNLAAIKQTRIAAIDAFKKEQEIKDFPNKYKIPMSVEEKRDIRYLNDIMPQLSYPEVLGKYIWSVYFQKKMKSFLSDILGEQEACGIYKITDQKTGESYIGQSRKVKERWQNHIKCGIGAMPASNANQLYASMKRDGVWNFTFELLEQCEPQVLDDKERWFIDLYSSDTIGLNSKRGNQSNTLKG